MRDMDELKGHLDVLPSLLALLETGSVTAAATRMHVTQPAMSRTLEHLRQRFGDPLLLRVGAGMRLTPRAQAMLEPLRQVLSAAAALYAPAGFDPATAMRRFRVIIPDVLAAPMLPSLLERFCAEAPGCTLECLPWAAWRDGPPAADLAITSETRFFPQGRLQPLFEDRDVLAARARPPRGADPMTMNHVAVQAYGLTQDPVDRWLDTLRLRRRITVVVPSYLLAMQLVASGRHCAILPSRLVARLGPALGVRAWPLRPEPPADQVWLVHPPELGKDAALRWLQALVVDVCGDATARRRRIRHGEAQRAATSS